MCIGLPEAQSLFETKIRTNCYQTIYSTLLTKILNQGEKNYVLRRSLFVSVKSTNNKKLKSVSNVTFAKILKFLKKLQLKSFKRIYLFYMQFFSLWFFASKNF